MRARDHLKENGYKSFPVPGGRMADHAYSKTIKEKEGKRCMLSMEPFAG